MTTSTSAPDRHPLDRTRSTPLYVQLTAALRGKIERGEWKGGQRIPSENELNRLYGISRVTVRQVLGQLVDEHLLFRVPGKGTYVAHSSIGAPAPAYPGIREQLERAGHPTTTALLSNEVIPADPTVATHLQISPNDPVHRLRRIRLVGEEPISLHTSFVPAALAADLGSTDLVHRQLCVVLDHGYGLRIGRVTESLESILPAAAEAKVLHTRRTAPLLLLRQDVADPNGLRFEYSRILFRGDRIRLKFQYDLHPAAGDSHSAAVGPAGSDHHYPAPFASTDAAQQPSRPAMNTAGKGRRSSGTPEKQVRGWPTGPLVRSRNRA